MGRADEESSLSSWYRAESVLLPGLSHVRRLKTQDSVPLSELAWPITLTDSSFPFRAIV